MENTTIAAPAVNQDILEKTDAVFNVLLNLMKNRVPLVVAWSGGKDSSAIVLMVLNAARVAITLGISPIITVLTSNTLIDNPEITMLLKREYRKMHAYAKQHGFEITTKIVTPNLNSTWQVNVVSGRGLPSFAGQDPACSKDLKVIPQETYVNSLMESLKIMTQKEPVTLLGTRFEESANRAENMNERGENENLPVRNGKGFLILSPIATWEEVDVWRLLSLAESGKFSSYSDFKDTRRIYAASEKTNCVLLASMYKQEREEADMYRQKREDAAAGITAKPKQKGGCGSRTGCVVCLQSADKSLKQMTEYEDRYAYAKGLTRLNDFLRKTRYDWKRRDWFGRTVKAGWISISPNTYHPRMLRELARYMMQLDFDEENRAAAIAQRDGLDAVGAEPMFELLTPEMLVAIDAIWSVQGLSRPHAIWADYMDIRYNGIRHDIPEVDEFPRTPVPSAKYLFIGDDVSPWNGLRDSFAEGVAECVETKQEINGDTFLFVERNKSFEIDAESVAMLMEFELDNMVARYHRSTGSSNGAAYKFYVMYGSLRLANNGQVRDHDSMLKRAFAKAEAGFDADYDVDALIAQSRKLKELDMEAQAAITKSQKEEVIPEINEPQERPAEQLELIPA